MMASNPITSQQIEEEKLGAVTDFVFLGSEIMVDGDCSHEIKRLLGRKALTKLDTVLKNRNITLPTKVCTVKTMFFPLVVYRYWELDHKEGWVPKNRCFWIVVLEKTLENPLECRNIRWVNPKGSQSWIFNGRTNADAPMLWPPDMKSQIIGNDPDAGKDWGQEKGTTEDEMIRLPDGLNEHVFEQTVRDSEGQGRQACCSPWGCKESDTT